MFRVWKIEVKNTGGSREELIEEVSGSELLGGLVDRCWSRDPLKRNGRSAGG
jgi:hypothetical protein